MKKTQVALAALALVASSAAMAQVTLSGSLDASIAQQNDGAGTATRSTFADGNWNGGSFLTFAGSEDLGNGLKAGFTLQSGFRMNDGVMANGGTINEESVFNRQANVSLSGAFGSVIVGQQLNQYIAGALGTNLPNAAFGAFSVNSILNGASGGLAGGFFTPNAVTYALPSLNGLNIAVQSQFRGSDASANTMTSASAAYALGGVKLSAGYIDRDTVYRAFSIGGSMPIDAFTVNLRYTSNNPDAAATTNQVAAGVAYALSSAVTLSLQHASNSGAGSQKLTNLAAHYALSKSTGVYAMYSQAKNGAGMFYSGGATNTTTDRSNGGVAVGLTTNF